MITKEILLEIAPRAKENIVEDLEKYFDKHLADYGVNTLLRVSHFLAQCAHESDSFRTLEEYASGAAYEGRKDLGNTEPGDGRRYKGRGIIQLTGRANYREYGNALGIDLENNPERALEPEVSVLTALEYWKKKKLNALADKDDVLTITKRINGGTNGLDDRKKYLARAKKFLEDFDFSPPKVEDKEVPVKEEPKEPNVILSKRGERSTYVKDIQAMLKDKDYKLAVDGIFGPQTESAVKQFQEDVGLPVTGYVDTATMKKLLA
jgi:putative chitinase